MRFAAETILGEALFEALKRFRIYRLGAVERSTPAAEVEAFDVLVGDLADAKFVGEIWRGGDGAAMLVKRPKPAFRPREERERGHDKERCSEMQKREPGADEAHVVIERQPADANVFGRHLNGFANRANVGEKVGVSEGDALWVAGRAGSVLQQRDVARFANSCARQMGRQRAGSRRWGLVGGVEQLFGVDNGVERANARAEQFGDGLGAAKSEKHADACVIQNCSLAVGVFFDAIGSERRIDGNRNRASKQNARVGNEECAGGREHERDTASWRNAATGQLCGATLGGAVEFSECQSMRFVASVGIFRDVHVGPLGVVLGAVAKDVNERLRSENAFIGGVPMERLHGGRGAQRGGGFGAQRSRRRRSEHGSRQLFGSVDFSGDAIGEPDAEIRLEPSQQLDAFEAAKSQFAIEVRLRAEHRQGTFAAQFGQQCSHYLQHAFARGRRIDLGAGCGHETPEGRSARNYHAGPGTAMKEPRRLRPRNIAAGLRRTCFRPWPARSCAA